MSQHVRLLALFNHLSPNSDQMQTSTFNTQSPALVRRTWLVISCLGSSCSDYIDSTNNACILFKAGWENLDQN